MRKLIVIAGIVVCLSVLLIDRSGNKIELFIIDSPTAMTKEDKQEMSLFPHVTHGSVVKKIVEDCGMPDQIIYYNVGSDDKGKIIASQYLKALLEVGKYMNKKAAKSRVLINISMGGYQYDALENLLIMLLIQKGAIIVAAAGNEGQECNNCPAAYPARFNGVIGVGALKNNKLAPYSNSGAGVNIYADGVYQSYEQKTIETSEGYTLYTREIRLHGTSFSAPKVAGALVKMLYLDPKLTNAKSLAILKEGALIIDSSRPNIKVLNAKAACRLTAKYADLKLLGRSLDFKLSSRYGSIFLFLFAIFFVVYFQKTGEKRLAAYGMAGLFLSFFVIYFIWVKFYLTIDSFGELARIIVTSVLINYCLFRTIGLIPILREVLVFGRRNQISQLIDRIKSPSDFVSRLALMIYVLKLDKTDGMKKLLISSDDAKRAAEVLIKRGGAFTAQALKAINRRHDIRLELSKYIFYKNKFRRMLTVFKRR